MKTFAIFWTALVCSVSSHASSKSDQALEEIVEFMGAEELTQNGLIDLLNRHSKIPIHSEWVAVLDDGAIRRFSFTLSDVSLREAIGIVCALIDSRMSVIDESVVITSNRADRRRLSIVSKPIDRFETEELDREWAAGKLFQLPVFTENQILVMTAGVGRDEALPKFSLDMQDASPREILCQICQRDGRSYWTLSYSETHKDMMGFSFGRR